MASRARVLELRGGGGDWAARELPDEDAPLQAWVGARALRLTELIRGVWISGADGKDGWNAENLEPNHVGSTTPANRPPFSSASLPPVLSPGSLGTPAGGGVVPPPGLLRPEPTPYQREGETELGGTPPSQIRDPPRRGRLADPSLSGSSPSPASDGSRGERGEEAPESGIPCEAGETTPLSVATSDDDLQRGLIPALPAEVPASPDGEPPVSPMATDVPASPRDEVPASPPTEVPASPQLPPLSCLRPSVPDSPEAVPESPRKPQEGMGGIFSPPPPSLQRGDADALPGAVASTPDPPGGLAAVAETPRTDAVIRRVAFPGTVDAPLAPAGCLSTPADGPCDRSQETLAASLLERKLSPGSFPQLSSQPLLGQARGERETGGDRETGGERDGRSPSIPAVAPASQPDGTDAIEGFSQDPSSPWLHRGSVGGAGRAALLASQMRGRSSAVADASVAATGPGAAGGAGIPVPSGDEVAVAATWPPESAPPPSARNDPASATSSGRLLGKRPVADIPAGGFSAPRRRAPGKRSSLTHPPAAMEPGPADTERVGGAMDARAPAEPLQRPNQRPTECHLGSLEDLSDDVLAWLDTADTYAGGRGEMGGVRGGEQVGQREGEGEEEAREAAPSSGATPRSRVPPPSPAVAPPARDVPLAGFATASGRRLHVDPHAVSSVTARLGLDVDWEGGGRDEEEDRHDAFTGIRGPSSWPAAGPLPPAASGAGPAARISAATSASAVPLPTFTTGLGTPIAVSAAGLKRARVLLGGDDDGDSSPRGVPAVGRGAETPPTAAPLPLPTFTTGLGTHVAVSVAGLERARALLGDDYGGLSGPRGAATAASGPGVATPPSSAPPPLPTFTTGLGTPIGVSAAGLKRARALLGRDNDGDASPWGAAGSGRGTAMLLTAFPTAEALPTVSPTAEAPPTVSPTAEAPPTATPDPKAPLTLAPGSDVPTAPTRTPLPAFTTGLGTPVSVSAASLRRAHALLGEDGRSRPALREGGEGAEPAALGRREAERPRFEPPPPDRVRPPTPSGHGTPGHRGSPPPPRAAPPPATLDGLLAAPPPLPTFSTSLGTPIAISAMALARARAMFSSEERDGDDRALLLVAPARGGGVGAPPGGAARFDSPASDAGAGEPAPGAGSSTIPALASAGPAEPTRFGALPEGTVPAVAASPTTPGVERLGAPGMRPRRASLEQAPGDADGPPEYASPGGGVVPDRPPATAARPPARATSPGVPGRARSQSPWRSPLAASSPVSSRRPRRFATPRLAAASRSRLSGGPERAGAEAAGTPPGSAAAGAAGRAGDEGGAVPLTSGRASSGTAPDPTPASPRLHDLGPGVLGSTLSTLRALAEATGPQAGGAGASPPGRLAPFEPPPRSLASQLSPRPGSAPGSALPRAVAARLAADLAALGAPARLATAAWASNAVALAAFKAARLAAGLGRCAGAALLRDEVVLDEIRRRCEREFRRPGRPPLKAILAGDEPPGQPLTLLVTGVEPGTREGPAGAPVAARGGSPGAPPAPGSWVRSRDPPASPVATPILELTDGWHRVLAMPDAPLARRWLRRPPRAGDKLRVSGALIAEGVVPREAIPDDDEASAFAPEGDGGAGGGEDAPGGGPAPSALRPANLRPPVLTLRGNSTRPEPDPAARIGRALPRGLVRFSPLSRAEPGGGPVPRTLVIVQRVYPPLVFSAAEPPGLGADPGGDPGRAPAARVGSSARPGVSPLLTPSAGFRSRASFESAERVRAERAAEASTAAAAAVAEGEVARCRAALRDRDSFEPEELLFAEAIVRSGGVPPTADEAARAALALGPPGPPDPALPSLVLRHARSRLAALEAARVEAARRALAAAGATPRDAREVRCVRLGVVERAPSPGFPPSPPTSVLCTLWRSGEDAERLVEGSVWEVRGLEPRASAGGGRGGPWEALAGLHPSATLPLPTFPETPSSLRAPGEGLPEVSSDGKARWLVRGARLPAGLVTPACPRAALDLRLLGALDALAGSAVPPPDAPDPRPPGEAPARLDAPSRRALAAFAAAAFSSSPALAPELPFDFCGLLVAAGEVLPDGREHGAQWLFLADESACWPPPGGGSGVSGGPLPAAARAPPAPVPAFPDLLAVRLSGRLDGTDWVRGPKGAGAPPLALALADLSLGPVDSEAGVRQAAANRLTGIARYDSAPRSSAPLATRAADLLEWAKGEEACRALSRLADRAAGLLG